MLTTRKLKPMIREPSIRLSLEFGHFLFIARPSLSRTSQFDSSGHKSEIGEF